jgi:hypothetical protein
MRDHIKVLGILNVILGSLTALLGLAGFLAMGTLAGIITASLASGSSDSDFHNGVIAAPIAATIGVAIAVFFLILGLPMIVGGWGLMRYKRWSRPLMIVVSVLQLFHVPVGTALGAYGLWVLMSDEGKRLLGVPNQSTPFGQVGPA